MKKFGGKVLFLDQADISMDEIIPAKALEQTDIATLKTYLFGGLKLAGFNQKTDIYGTNVIISRENFACGTFKEQALAAFKGNGINVVVSSSFGRNFRANMFNSGLMAIELPKKDIDDIFRTFADKDTEAQVVIDKEENTSKVKLISGSLSKSYYFRLEGMEKECVYDENWIGYAEN